MKKIIMATSLIASLFASSSFAAGQGYPVYCTNCENANTAAAYGTIANNMFNTDRMKRLAYAEQHLKYAIRTMVGVQDAVIVVADNDFEPKASVFIVLREGQKNLAKEQIAAIRLAVAGGIDNLSVDDINIVDNLGNIYQQDRATTQHEMQKQMQMLSATQLSPEQVRVIHRKIMHAKKLARPVK